MKDFRNYLDSKRFASKKINHFYALWVKKMYDFNGKKFDSNLKDDDITHFINHLSKNNQDWQVKQAEQAIKLFIHYKSRNHKSPIHKTENVDEMWKVVADEMVNMLRLKQRALDTEKSYMYWLRQFYRFLNGRSPYLINTAHVKNFLTYLAVDRHVAPSTQNQALNAILFFFRHVLDKDLGDIQGALRAQKKFRLPVIFTKEEIENTFKYIDGIKLLMSQISYGGGLRLKECIKLRIKDIDFERACIKVYGKGGKERETLLPSKVIEIDPNPDSDFDPGKISFLIQSVVGWVERQRNPTHYSSCLICSGTTAILINIGFKKDHLMPIL